MPVSGELKMLKWVPYSSKLHAISSFIQRKAGSQKARWGLYFYSALESIIIPVPTDPLLAACVYAAPKRWWKLAIWTGIYSVIGGLIGWGLGWFMGDLISFMLQNDTIPFLSAKKFESVSNGFSEHGLLIIVLGAFTPLPFKLVTITAGLFQFGVLPFIIAALFGRTVRFLLVAGLVKYHQNPKILILISSIIGIVITVSYIIIGH
jgi:membrane protein YqaA with SNARE-associated domain